MPGKPAHGGGNRAPQSRGGHPSGTPYDDAWRTLTTSVPRLLIPMVNEVFGTRFTKHATVVLKQNEHMFSGIDGRTEKRVTDTSFSVLEEAAADSLTGNGFDIAEGDLVRHYIFECESKAVSPAVLIRLVEYSVKAAAESGTAGGKAKITLRIPQTAVLSLRSTASTPSEMELEIIMESGSCSSAVRVMKLSDYSTETVFEKELYLLIPFLLFNYEKRFAQMEREEQELQALAQEFSAIFRRIDALTPADEAEETSVFMDLFTNKMLRAMTHTVIDGLTKNYPEIRKGVRAVVGGEIIETEAMRIKREGIREGWRKGQQEGWRKGQQEGWRKGQQEGWQKGQQEGWRKGQQEGADGAFHAMAEGLIAEGVDGNLIMRTTGFTRPQLDSIARDLRRSVNWNDTPK